MVRQRAVAFGNARSDGTSFATFPMVVDSAWRTWRVTWNEAGMYFWRDYVDGAKPYFSVPAVPIKGRWPFNQPGYWLSPMLTLAVGGPGAGDPNLGNFPVDMLVDWIRVW